MNKFSIFRPGKHTSAAGQLIEFTDDDLSKTIEAYNPEVHEAPIVVGHPQHNRPAYGWVKSIAFADNGEIEVEAHQVDPQFQEMVEAGRFKKRSASFYTPESPNNPVPGVFYLRHVGWLGAQPPAVKGLRDIEFDEAEEGVVEFADPYIVASLFRRLREFIVDKFDTDEADRVIPDFLVQDLEAEARMPADIDQPAAAFNEPNGDNDMTLTPQEIQELQDRNAELTAQNQQLTTENASFTEREQAIADREAAVRRQEIEDEVNKHVQAGKILPAEKANLVAFLEGLDDEVEVEFTEGDKTNKMTRRKFMESFIEGRPPVVDLGEHGNGGQGGDELHGKELANRAAAFREDQKKKGIVMSTTEAVDAVRNGKDK